MIESPICSCGWDINIGRIADPGCLEHKTWNTGCPRCEALKAKLRVAEEALRNYANENLWDKNSSGFWVYSDRGPYEAKEALARLKGES